MERPGYEEDRRAEPFVGKATEKFLTKTCRAMMGSELVNITPEQIDSLAYWVRMGALRLMPTEKVDHLVEAILRVKSRQS